MKRQDKDLGVIMALLQRLENYRMPRALKLKKKVDRGELLTKTDMDFVKTMLADGKKIEPLVKRNPQYEELVEGMKTLLNEITKKALENEKNQ